MSRRALQVLAVLAGGLSSGGSAPAAEALPPPSIVRIELPPESEELRPFAMPTEPENTLEIDFPWPVEDWAGRGFTPDPERFAGDFVIEATRGKARIFVTPVAAQAHRVLHVVLTLPGGGTRGVPIELVPAPTGLAWRKVVFEVHQAPAASRRQVSLALQPPRTRLRDPSPESEIAMVRTLRLMLEASADGAAAVAAANPALELGIQDGAPRSFGDYTLSVRFALRDATTDTLGLCVSIASQSDRRLFFDPGGWVVRAGDRVYPIRTLDFSNELEPGSTEAAFLVLARAPGADPTLLLPDNAFEVSAVLCGSSNPRPVSRFALEGFKE